MRVIMPAGVSASGFHLLSEVQLECLIQGNAVFGLNLAIISEYRCVVVAM